jgi:hypothetical protein
LEEVIKYELQEVLHSFRKDKIPSLDGWPIEFFLGFYELLEDDVLRVTKESRINGKILVDFNSTFIAFIPKEVNLVSYEEYMPISLCNCTYIIKSNIIAKRIGSLLSRTGS